MKYLSSSLYRAFHLGLIVAAVMLAGGLGLPLTGRTQASPFLIAQPMVTLGVPTQGMLGEPFSFTATFDNNYVAPPPETGYGPFIDLVFPVNGTDGLAGTDTPDGLDFVSASYLGTAIDASQITQLIFPGPAGSVTCVDHPLATTPPNNPLQVCGPSGDKLVVIQLPFGSFTPDQPPATVTINTSMSILADLSLPMSIYARGGFQYGLDPLNNPCCDASLVEEPNPDSTTWNSSSITPTLVTLEKSNDGPEGETATGPNYPRQYTLTLDIADGQTITDFDIDDYIDDNIVLLNLPTISPVGTLVSLGGAAPAFPYGPAVANGTANQLHFNIPTVTGGAGSNDVVITFNFYVTGLDAGGAPVIDPNAGDDTVSENRASATGDWTPIDTRDTGGTDNVVVNGTCPSCPPIDTLQDQSIAIQKGVVSVSGPVRSDATLQYTLSFQISDYFSFDDMFITDIISDGQRFDTTFPPILTVSDQSASTAGGSFTITNTTNPALDCAAAAGDLIVDTSEIGNDLNPATDGSTRLVFCISEAMIANGQLDGILQGGRTQGVAGPATGTIVYRTVVQDNFSDTYPSGDPSVDHGDILTNNAIIDGQIVDNTTLLPAGYGREPDNTNGGVSIAQGGLTKSIYAVNGSTIFSTPVEVRPGDTVTYRLRYTMPSTDFEDFVIEDYLPLPVFDVAELTTFDYSLPLDGTIPPAGTAKYLATGATATYDRMVAVLGGNPPIPAMTTDATSNSVIFTFGDFDDPANTDSVVDIIFTVTVLADPFADGLFLTNQAHAYEDSTNAGNQQQDAIVQIVLREPVLLVRKGVLDTDSPVEILTPATVSPVPVEDVNSTTSPPFTGVINSTNLAANPIDSDVEGVDAGDFVRFAIVIENVGGSSAFDIILTDVVPPGFVLPADPDDLHLQVWQGDNATPISYIALGPNGDARDLFGSGIELIDPAAGVCQAYHPGDGTNLVVVTYDLPVDVTALAGGTVQNLATVTQYAGVDGGGPTDNHVDDVALFQDDAAVTVIAPSMVKTRTATGIVSLSNSTDQAVIGETITYQLDITVPEGTTQDAQVIDTLDTGLAIVDPAAVSATLPAGVTISGSTIPAVSGGGTVLTFNLGNVVNTNTDSTDPNPANRVDEVIILTYDVVVLNVAGNQAGTTLNNSAVFSWNDGTATRTQSAVSAADVTVIEPDLEVLKSAAPNTGDAGDTLTFTLTVQHTAASHTDAFDVTLSDVVPAGMTYVAASWTHTGGVAPTSTDDSDPAGTGLAAGWDTLPLGQSSTMQFLVTLDAGVEPDQVIDNIADTAWTSLPGNPGQISTATPDSTERDGSGGINDYNATVTEPVTVDSIATVKSLVSTSEGHTTGTAVAIGEIVRYRIEVTIPESLAAPMLITDVLPDGLQFLDDSTALIAFVSNDAGITSTVLSGAGLDVSGNEATVGGITPTFGIPGGQISPATFSSGTDPVFDLGTVQNLDRDADDELIVIEFNALVLNNPGSNDDGDTRNNTAFVTINGTPRAGSNTQQVQIVEPALTIAKTPDGATGDAGDTVTFTAVITNTGSTDAFDITWTDVVPAGFTYVGGTLNNTVGVAPASSDDSDPAGAGLTATWTTLAAGQSSTLTFDVTLDYTLGPAQTVTNTAGVTWTSLPGPNGTTGNVTGSDTPGNSGDDNGERNGTSPGTHNDYSATDTGDVTISSPAPGKEILTTSEAHTDDDAALDGSPGNERPLVVGEILRYRLTSTIPEGTSTDFQIVDTLSAGLAPIQDAQVTVQFFSDSGINPVTNPGLNAGAAYPVLGGANTGPFALYDGAAPGDGSLVNIAGQVVTFNLGTLLNNDSDANTEMIVIDFNVLVLNDAASTLGQVLDNTFDVVINGATVATSNTVSAIVQEPTITVGKTAAPASGDAGDPITFTVTLTNPGGTNVTTAFDTQVQDILPADFTSLAFNPATDVNLGGCATGVTDASSMGTNTLDVTIGAIPAGCTVTITYTANLAITVEPDETYTNTANVTWTSLPGPNGTTGNPTGSDTPGASGDTDGERDGTDGAGGLNDYATTASDSVTIGTPAVSKATAAVDVVVGEVFTYTLTLTLPEGTMTGVTVQDQFDIGLGLVDVVSVQAFSGAVDATDTVVTTDLAGGFVDASNDGVNPTIAGDGVVTPMTIDWNLGTITNHDTDNGMVETLVITYTAIPLNDGAVIRGTILDNAVTVGYVNDSGPQTLNASANAVTVTEPELIITKTASPTSGLDAGDTITYMVSVYHTAASDADAFDVTITDIIDGNLTYAGNLTLVSGVLPTVDASGDPTILFGWGSIPGTVTAGTPYTFTFDATVTVGATPGLTIPNAATLTWTSISGDLTTPQSPYSGVSTERTGDTGHPGGANNDYIAVDTVDVTTAGLSIDKSIVTTSEPHTVTASPEPLAIGEILRYQLAVELVEGTMNDVVLTDTLATGLALIQDEEVTVTFLSTPAGDVTSSNAGLNPGTPGSPVALYDNAGVVQVAGVITVVGQDLTFDLGDLTNTNTNNASAEYATVEFNVLVLNDAANTLGVVRANAASVTIDGGPAITSPTVNAIIVEPNVAITKTAAPATGDGGDPITFTVLVSNPAGANVTTAFDVRVLDTLPLDYTNLVVTSAPPGATDNSAGTTLDVIIPAVAPGATATITYTANLLPSVIAGQTITNTADTTWTSLPGPNGTTGNPTGSDTPGASGDTDGERNDDTGASGGANNDYTTSDTADVDVTGAYTAVKSIEATSEPHTVTASPEPLAIGEILRYQLAVTIPEGTSTNVQLVDQLADGIQIIQDSTVTVEFVADSASGITGSTNPALDAANSGPLALYGGAAPLDGSLVNVAGSPQLVTFNLGTLANNDNDANTETVIIRFNGLVLNDAANTLGVVRANTFDLVVDGSTAATSNTVSAVIVEPTVGLTKTATPTTGDAGDTITFTLTISNTPTGANAAALFDLTGNDPLPTGYTNLRNAVGIAGATGAVIGTSIAGNTLSYTVDRLDPGESATITYDADLAIGVTPGQVVTNTASVAGTSLPGPNGTTGNPTGSDTPGNSGDVDGERNGSGGVNDYTVNDTADVTVTGTAFTKELASTSAAHTTGSSVTIGEMVAYVLAITLPEGTTPTLQVIDDLPAGLDYVPGSLTVDTTNPPLAAPFNGTVPAPTITAPGGSGADVTADFTNIVVNADGNPANNVFLIRLQAVVLDVPGNVGAPAGPGQTALVNNASIQIGGNPAVNATPHTSTVVEPQPTVTKTFTPNTGTINDVVRVTLVIDNTTGTSDLFDITFEDQFDTSLLTNITPVTTPAGFTYAALVDTPAVGITTVQYTGGPVPAGATAVFEIDLTLTPGVTAGQIIPNTADVVDSTTLPGPDANERPYTPSGSDNLTVSSPDLTITKTHVGNFTVGVNGAFTLTVSNLPGSGYATGTISVTDVVPPNLVVQSAGGTGWDCTGTVGQNVSCTRPGPVAPGVTLPVITLVVQPDAGAVAASPIFNTANVPYPADVNAGNNSDDDTVTILAAPEPDLAITKSHVGDFQVGVNGTFTIRIQNVGSAATTGTITLDDVLPAGLTLVSASGSSWNCINSVVGGQTIQCTTAAIVAPGAFATDITVVVAVDAAAVPGVTNTANVSTPGDSNAANDSDDDAVTVNSSVAPDLAPQKTHSGNMLEGINANFTITVQNVGSGPTTGPVTITDTVPAALVVQSASGPNWDCAATVGQNVSCTYIGGPIPAASTLADVITVTVQPAAGSAATSPYTNTATVSTPGDSNAANNSDDDTVTVDASAAPDLAPQKTHSGNMLEGVNADFTITVQNVGSGPTTGPITITDTVPAALVVQSASGPNWDCAASVGQNVTCTYTGGPIPAASTLADAITVIVQPAAGSAATSPFTNTATVATPGDTNAANDSDDDTVTVDASAAPDLTPQKTHSGGNFAVGVNGAFTITVQNVGSGPTTGPVTITDAVPAALVVQNVSGPNWDCAASVGQNVACTYTGGPIAAASTLADAITVTVRPSTTSGSPFTNTATVSTPGDSNTANNSDDDVVVVDGALTLDLSIQKTHAGNFVVGIDGVYTVTVTNVSAAPTTGTITVTDTLPIGLGFLNGTGDIGGTAWSCAAVGQTVTCTNTAVLPPGASSDITLTVSVGAGAVGTQINVVNVSTPGDSNAANNDDVDATTVQLTAEPDLAISKSHVGDFILNNPAPYSYTITVQNVGAADAAGPIRVTDPVPAAYLTLDSASGTDWDCSATAGNNVDCTYTGPLPLAAGDTLPPITLSVFADQIAGTVDNVATVSAPNDNNPANNVAPDRTVVNSPTLYDPPFGLKVVDSSGLPVLQWGMIWLNPTNNALNVQVTDVIPPNTTYQAGTLSCVADGGSSVTICSYNPATNTITWTGLIAPDPGIFDPAAAANAVVITFNTLLDPGAAGATNVAVAAWDGDGDGDISDDVAAGQTPGPGQQPSATYGRPAAAPAAASDQETFSPVIQKEAIWNGVGLVGEPLAWVITVSNEGGAAGNNVVITDILPDYLTIVAVRPDRGSFSLSGQTVTVNLGTLGPRETVIIRIETTVNNIPADGRLFNLATLNAAGIAPPLTASDEVLVTPPQDLPNTGYPPSEPSD